MESKLNKYNNISRWRSILCSQYIQQRVFLQETQVSVTVQVAQSFKDYKNLEFTTTLCKSLISPTSVDSWKIVNICFTPHMHQQKDGWNISYLNSLLTDPYKSFKKIKRSHKCFTVLKAHKRHQVRYCFPSRSFVINLFQWIQRLKLGIKV